MFNRPSTTYRIVFHIFNMSLKVKKCKIKLNTQHVSVTYDHSQVSVSLGTLLSRALKIDTEYFSDTLVSTCDSTRRHNSD
jgi:hypothetical protein